LFAYAVAKPVKQVHPWCKKKLFYLTISRSFNEPLCNLETLSNENSLFSCRHTTAMVVNIIRNEIETKYLRNIDEAMEILKTNLNSVPSNVYGNKGK